MNSSGAVRLIPNRVMGVLSLDARWHTSQFQRAIFRQDDPESVSIAISHRHEVAHVSTFGDFNVTSVD